jgi:ribosomal protein S18 acetylase RimI-like enzyme
MANRTWHIEPISRDNLKGLVTCHLRCFPDYFLSNLGESFLMLFYEDFLESPIGLGFLAVDDASGEVVGLVTGNLDGPAFRSWSLKRKRAAKARIAFGRLFCCIRLWGQLVLRGARAFVSVLKRLAGRSKTGVLDPRNARARLLSISVIPEMRGTGVASDLIRRFEEACAERGEARVGLSVYADNEGAIRFYEKSGWTRLEGRGPGVRFVKELKPSA